MLRGLILGSVSALASATIVLSSVSLLLPPPSVDRTRVPDRPGPVAPPDAGEAQVVRPEPLPGRTGAEIATGIAVVPDREDAPPVGVSSAPPAPPAAATVAPEGPRSADAPVEEAPVLPNVPLAGDLEDGGAVARAEAPAAPIRRSPAGTELRAVPLVVPSNEVEEIADAPEVADPVEPRVVDAGETTVIVERPEPADAPVTAVPADEIVLPAGSQFGRPREDGPVVTPEGDARPRLEVGAVPAGPVAPTMTALADTDPAAVPGAAVEVGGALAAPAEGTVPNLPAPIDEAAPETFRQVATTQNDVLADAEAVDLVEIDPVPPADEAAPGAVTEQVEPAPEDVAEAALENGEATLPRRIVLDSARAAEAPERADDASSDAPATASEAQPPVRALDLYAGGATQRSDRPAFSIILIDTPEAGLDRAALAEIDFPVTFAVDPARPDAREVMRTYRDAGHEVLLLSDGLTPDGSAQDIETSLAGARAAVPEAIGVLDPAPGGFAGRQPSLAALLPALEERGMGFVAPPGGLGTAAAEARRGGVPAAQLYRILDEGGERAPVIARFLDRATFEAAQSGATVVVGRTTPETISGIYTWTLGDRFDTVDVVPVSEVLEGPSGG